MGGYITYIPKKNIRISPLKNPFSVITHSYPSIIRMKLHDFLISNPGRGRIFSRATLGWVGMFRLDHLTLLNAMLLGKKLWQDWHVMGEIWIMVVDGG